LANGGYIIKTKPTAIVDIGRPHRNSGIDFVDLDWKEKANANPNCHCDKYPQGQKAVKER
jgi:hypothetical protein